MVVADAVRLLSSGWKKLKAGIMKTPKLDEILLLSDVERELGYEAEIVIEEMGELEGYYGEQEEEARGAKEAK